MKRLLHRMLYRCLPLEGYLRTVSGLFFVVYGLGLGRRSVALEYVYLLRRLVHPGDTAIDIGANLGYYTRPLSRLVGATGCVHAVEPVAPIRRVLVGNLRGRKNVQVHACALGEREGSVRLVNPTVATEGYFATGRNAVAEGEPGPGACFEAPMQCGSHLFAELGRIDFIKCDIEGSELTVMHDMQALIVRHRPTVLIETGGANRRAILDLFSSLGYRAQVLDGGRLRDVREEDEKDILFTHPEGHAH